MIHERKLKPEPPVDLMSPVLHYTNTSKHTGWITGKIGLFSIL